MNFLRSLNRTEIMLLIVGFLCVSAIGAVWVGAQHNASVNYENQVESCQRVNRTVRTPLHNYTAKLYEVRDGLPPGVAPAVRTLWERTDPVPCRKEIEKP